MKEVLVVGFPYVVESGKLEVPDELTGDELYAYVESHWDDIQFEEDSRDYYDTEFEVYED